jgi:hypothetical protein
MAIGIKYIGPKPSKKFRGQTFIQDTPRTVTDDMAGAALEHPTVFMQSDVKGTADIDPEVLALRDSIGDAYIAAGEYHEEQFQDALAQAKQLPETDKAEKAKKKAWIEGAKDEIAHGRKLQAQGEALNAAREGKPKAEAKPKAAREGKPKAAPDLAEV